jgi:hypothetical protein
MAPMMRVAHGLHLRELNAVNSRLLAAAVLVVRVLVVAVVAVVFTSTESIQLLVIRPMTSLSEQVG